MVGVADRARPSPLCASFLLAAGASPRTVMKTLGHSQIGLTMNTYTNVLAAASVGAPTQVPTDL
jgi:Site-specific recombinase XerD